MKVKINAPSVRANIPSTQRISSGGKTQIYIGDTEPTDENILIWIDTSGVVPVVGTQLITSNNKKFKTKDNKAFILKEGQKSQLITSDGLNFITSDDKEFILKEE